MPRTRRTGHAALLAAAAALLVPATALAAAPHYDAPAGAADFVAVTAENGTPGEREAVLDLTETTPDAGVPRCLGAVSFERTAWAWVEPADHPRRIVVDAAPRDRSTQTPDLALFPQDPVVRSTADASEPAACDGRETLGDGARRDGAAAVVAVLRAGCPALVQVGWRAGDAPDAIVLSLNARPLDRVAPPPGDDPAGAPELPLGVPASAANSPLVSARSAVAADPASVPGAVRAGSPAVVALGGATLGRGDPAQPACQAPATVWRRVVVPRAGSYAIAATGAAQTLTAFADPPGGDSALACADLADSAALGLVVEAPAAGPLWIRVGTDELGPHVNAQLVASGPYADPRQAGDALPTAGEPLAPAGPGAGAGPGTGTGGPGPRSPACVNARAPRLTIAAAALRDLRTGRGRIVRGTVRQPCDTTRPRAERVQIALTRSAAAPARTPRARGSAADEHATGAARRNANRRAARANPKLRFTTARGVATWSRRFSRRLAPGRYVLTVRVVSRTPGQRSRTRVTSTTRRSFTVSPAKPKPTRRSARGTPAR